MRPSQVLDMQADLLRRLDTDDGFREFVVGTLTAAHDGHGRPLTDPNYTRRNAEAMRVSLQAGVRTAYAFRVTADMVRVVEHVAMQLDEHDRFDRGLAPTGCGIVRLESPIRFIDVRGQTLLIHWIVWAPVGVQLADGTRDSGTGAFYFNDHFDGPDDVAKTLRQMTGYPRSKANRLLGRWGFIGADVYADTQLVGGAFNEVTPEMAAKIVAAGDTPHEFTNLVRYLHALWLLMGQTITTVEPEYVERGARKRIGRAGIPGRVSVVQLRRTESRRGEGESLVEWSHRWLVRQHPRWQPYGERSAGHGHDYGPQVVERGRAIRYCQVRGCEARLERIVINSYVKGPPDKPLVISEKVYDLRR